VKVRAWRKLQKVSGNSGLMSRQRMEHPPGPTRHARRAANRTARHTDQRLNPGEHRGFNRERSCRGNKMIATVSFNYDFFLVGNNMSR
jgi:hypothetical protein